MNVGYVVNVYFAHNGVDPISYESIRNLAAMMKNSSTMKVEISGYTDSKGDEKYNENLSLRRAQSVRNTTDQTWRGWQQDYSYWPRKNNPVETNDTMEGRRKNRRIEFRILEP